MNILIDESTVDPAIVIALVSTTIKAGNGNLHVRTLDGQVVKVRDAVLGRSGTSDGHQRWYLASTVGPMTLVYLDDVEWIEGYEGK